MKVAFEVTEGDIEVVRDLIRRTKGNPFVQLRVKRNVTGKAPRVTPTKFWRVMMGCLLSTQQRSGPGSRLEEFLSQRPFPLSREKCLGSRVSKLVEREVRKFGGLRRGPTVGNQAEANLLWMESGRWKELRPRIRELAECRSRRPRLRDRMVEREAARFIDKSLKGFGPKQSRNLWQWMGLSRYEIPLDSRFTKWLNQNEILPWQVSARNLADQTYYELVLDGVQTLSSKARVLPCVLDAAVFSDLNVDS